MTLTEFRDAVLDDDLTDGAIKARWQKFCHVLASLEVDIISDLIHDGCLDSLAEAESADAFGTEGMNL